MLCYCIGFPLVYSHLPARIRKHARRKKLCKSKLAEMGVMSTAKKHGLCFCSFADSFGLGDPAMPLAPLYAVIQRRWPFGLESNFVGDGVG